MHNNISKLFQDPLTALISQWLLLYVFLNVTNMTQVTWIFIHGRQTCQEKVAANIKFQHLREVDMLKLVRHLIKRFSFLVNFTRLLF